MSSMSKREARQIIREHWYKLMQNSDMPDPPYGLDREFSADDIHAIEEVFGDETSKIAERVFPAGQRNA